MKVALLQLNPTVGDLRGNSDIIARAARRAGTDIDLFVTSELALLGYPPRDLLLRPPDGLVDERVGDAFAIGHF